ncbi:MAG: hypothetical protein JXA42_01515 [Anaerolineales bacterium]|nr:hypothetical protein [Anaerolineales bacterium]
MISKNENLMRVLRGQDPEWIPVECPANPAFGQNAYQFVTYQGALPPQDGGLDLWGTRWQGGAGEELPYIVEYPVPSVETLADFAFPDIDDPALWNQVRAQVDSAGDKLAIGRQVACLWERFYFLVGFDKALIALLDQPGLVREILDRIVAWQIAAGKRFIECGVDAVRISDDYGSQQNLLMSPRTWRKLIRPNLSRLVDFYHHANVPVALHSCGNLQLIMDDLIELNFAAFNIQTNANELALYKKRYGRRFRLWGGVSTQSVLAGEPSLIRPAVIDICELFGRDGCLILEPDQVINIPEENLRVFWETAGEMNEKLFGRASVGERE